MTQETLERITTMDTASVETQIALHCAPMIMGLKTSNLLIVPESQTVCVQRLLWNTKMESFLLYTGKQRTAEKEMYKTVLLLYRISFLRNYLQDAQVVHLLRNAGYKDFSFEGLLHQFASRYRAYRHGKRDFPHEMGIFLGYPPADVQGFIQNNGKYFLYAGYWKVYENQAQKTKLFYYYDLAAELLIRLLSQGVRIKDVLVSA